jgi:hypothetical protein
VLEVAVVIGFDGKPLYWHRPSSSTASQICDSRDLWDVLWENRHRLWGVAHSHPGAGLPSPSYTDLTTFAAVEAALGRRFVWWIASETHLSGCVWRGFGGFDYSGFMWHEHGLDWVVELREISGYHKEEVAHG